MNMQYFNFKEGLNNKGKLLTKDEIDKLNIDPMQDAYISIFKYNDKHKEIFNKTGSIAGMKDVTTDKLVWDFDSEKIENAKKDVLELGHRLVGQYKVDPDSIKCYWSGNKGYHVVVDLNKEITPDQFKKAVTEIASGLQTFDTVVSDPARIIRLEHTRHPKSGLYKIPLHIGEVETYSTEQIKQMAKQGEFTFNDFNPEPVKLPETLFEVKEKKKKETVLNTEKFNPKSCPKGWKPYKWALAEGFFDSGERHQALMVIAATCRGLGYPKDHTYYLCKTAIKKQAERSGQPEFSKEELYQNIIEDSIFSDSWEGGQYSPKTNPWLAKYCERMGFKAEDEREEKPTVSLDSLINIFTDYSTNFEQNLIKTGIKEIDENVIFSTSTLNGILGQPGSGKTTVVLEILRNASINNVPSMFFSLDMGPPLIFSKLIQKESGYSFKEAMKIYKENAKKREEINHLIKTKYRNIGLNFTCGTTVTDIRNRIQSHSEETGVYPKLIVIDYLENISGPYSDNLANAAMISNQLKDLATELQVCVILLLQTQKHSTPDVSDPLMSMKQIKGASSIEQNCSVIMTLWREGYNPDHVSDDKYISFAIVKNRFGSMWKTDMSWEPIRGQIRSLTEEEREELEKFKKRKRQAKIDSLGDKKEWV